MSKKGKLANNKRKKTSHRVGPLPVLSNAETERLQWLLEHGLANQLIEEGEKLLRTYPREAHVHSILGQLYARLGSETKAWEHLEAAARFTSSDSGLDYVRAINYESLGLHSHALRAARRFLVSGTNSEEAEDARRMVRTIEDMLKRWAAEFDTSIKRMEQGSFLMEEGRLTLYGGDFHQAFRLSREAMSLLPKWAVPRNNAALAQFFLGKVEDAMAIEVGVLAELDQNNIHALANLVRFHLTLGHDKEGKEYGKRLENLTPVFYNDYLKMVEAFGLLGCDRLVLDLLEKTTPPNSPSEKEKEWLMGIAAANLGMLQEARSHMLRAGVEGDLYRSKVANLVNAGLPGPGGRYRFQSAVQDLPQTLIKRIVSRLGEQESGSIQSLRDMTKKYPALIDIAAEWVWLGEDDLARKAVGALLAMSNEKAIEILTAFATGQVGSDEMRTYAAAALASLKRETSDEPLVVYRQGQPTPVLARELTIVTEKESNYSRDIHRMLREAIIVQREGKLDKAEQLYYRILSKNARVKEAISNLAGIYYARGDVQRAEEQYWKAINLDPLYVSARANLASLRLEEGKIEEAKELLRPLQELKEWHIEEMIRYQGLMARVAIKEERYDDAEINLKLVLELEPDNEWAKDTMDRLITIKRLGEIPDTFHNWFQQRRERYKARKQKQLISPDDSLLALLARYPKDALIGVAREVFLSSVSGLKKDVLLAAIQEALLDPESLQDVIGTLREVDLTALCFVMQAGGMVSLTAFEEKYGDDATESPYWNYHIPETILGRLKVRSLLFEGTYQGQIVLVVPAELRPLVQSSMVKGNS